MPSKIEMMLELERRGKLPESKVALIAELRKRNVIPGGPQVTPDVDTSLGEYTDLEVSQQEAEEYGRGALETGGMVAGGIGGSFVMPGPGTIAGEIGGFVGGRKLGDVLYGSREGATLAKDFGTGAAYSVIPRAVGTAVKGGLRALPKRVPDKLYRSAVKFNVTQKESSIRNALDAAFENRIHVDMGKKGQVRMVEAIDNLSSEITEVLIPHKGKLIYVDDVLAKTAKAKEKFKDFPLTQEYIDTIDDLVVKFKTERGATITLEQAHEIKKKAWLELDAFFRRANLSHPTKGTTASQEFNRALGDALKEAVETNVPGIKELNARMGGLLELQKAVDKAVGRLSNKELVTLLDVVAVDATRSGEAWGTGLKAMIARKFLEWPKFKSYLAVEIANAANRPLVKARPGVSAIVPGIQNLLGGKE